MNVSVNGCLSPYVVNWADHRVDHALTQWLLGLAAAYLKKNEEVGDENPKFSWLKNVQLYFRQMFLFVCCFFLN